MSASSTSAARAPRCVTFENGLRAVFVPCEAESVAFGLFVASGSRHEPKGVGGISHLIEHTLFKGTKSRGPADITRAIEGRGGNVNACTSEEGTCYFAHLPSECLRDAVDILADMYLNATIPDDEFDREKKVVIEEIRMYSDEPDAVAMENLQRNLFPGSPLGLPVAGTPKTLEPLVPERLRRYISSCYRPENTVAVLAGSFDDARAESLVRGALGTFRAGRRVARSADVSPFGLRPVHEQTVRKDVSQAQLALGYRTFGIEDGRKYAATVLDAVLGRGMMSRLFQELREKRGLSYDISSRMQFFSDAGMFSITAGLDAASKDVALATIDRELDRVRERKVPAAELKRTKEFLVGNFRLSHEKVTSKLFYYGHTMLSFGRLVSPREQIDGIRSVTAADVQGAARAMFRPGCRSVSWVLPKEV